MMSHIQQKNIRLLEDFLDFLRGKVPGSLENQADSEKDHR